MKKMTISIILIVLLGLGAFVYIRYLMPISDIGVKAGILNNIKHKGYIFKTYEGELIQTGFKSSQAGIHSNEFQFSIDNKELAEKMMLMSGQHVQVFYKEYLRPIPWRGYTKYIVDSVIPLQTPGVIDSNPPLDAIAPSLMEN